MAWIDKIMQGVSIATACYFSLEAQAAPVKKPTSTEIISGCIKSAAGGSIWLEKTLWGIRDQEGGEVGTVSRNRDGSEDLGPMQINSWWIAPIARALQRDRNQVRTWLINDPCFNVQAARWVFVSGLHASKDYWRAIGIYHSPTASRQRLYSALVATRIRARFGDNAIR